MAYQNKVLPSHTCESKSPAEGHRAEAQVDLESRITP